MIVKDTKYIIKRIIIGVGIALVLMLIKGTLFMDVQAQEINATPDDIVLTIVNSNPVTYSPTSNTWNNQQVWALPSNISYDWPSGSSLYFRYPQNAGATYCSQYSNKATLSGRLYNASTSDIGSQLVKYEDTTSGGVMACSFTKTNNFLDFICNNVPSNHGFNIQLQNAVNGRWGIVGQLNFECIISGADISGSINAQSNQNTQNIINNNNQNTQNIINNNNENNEKLINSMYACRDYKYSTSAQLKNSYLTNTNTISDSSGWGVSRYVPIYESTKILQIRDVTSSSTASYCFYTSAKNLLSCTRVGQTANGEIPIPQNASFVRFSLRKDGDRPIFQVCSLQGQVINEALTDSDVDQANSDFETYFNDFSINIHGLSDIVTAPLRLVQGLLGTTCSTLRIPLPFVNQDIVLPCMSGIYQTYFGDFLALYQLIMDGVIAYWVAVNVFRKVQGFLDPTDAKVEVLDL